MKFCICFLFYFQLMEVVILKKIELNVKKFFNVLNDFSDYGFLVMEIGFQFMKSFLNLIFVFSQKYVFIFYFLGSFDYVWKSVVIM